MSPKKEIRKRSSKKTRTRNTGMKPVPGTLTLAPKPNAAAKAVARCLAEKIRYEVVTAAAAPLTKRFAKDSCAAVMQDYLKKNSARQVPIRTKAQSILAAPAAKQKKYFGRYADMDALTRKKAASGDDPVLESAIRTALEKELVKHKAFDRNGILGRLKGVPILKTKLRIDFTSGEFQGSNFYRIDTELNQPDILRFDWETIEAEVTHAKWVMKYPSGAGIVTKKRDAGLLNPGKFSIDFHEFLSETPPAQPQTCLIRVQPMKDVVTAVGDPSNWVSVTYRKASGSQQFDLPDENTGHYQHIEFFINTVKCIEETGEASESDEILLGGATVLSGGRVYKQGVWTVSDDFDQGEVEPEPSHRPILWSSFKLFPMEFSDGNLLGQEPTDNPNLPWPKAFTFTLVMVERDTGGFEEIITNLIIRIIDYLQGWIEKIIKGYISQYVGEEAAGIITMVITALTSELFGLLKDLLDDPDDAIDQQTFVLRLESSKVSYIHSLPGHVKNLGQAYGLATEQTEFESNRQVFRFQGGDESSGGVYDVEVFWKANHRYFNY
jgi:hypothetical protein